LSSKSWHLPQNGGLQKFWFLQENQIVGGRSRPSCRPAGAVR
jgi:hypothetical protein